MSTKSRSYRVPRRMNRRNLPPVVSLGNCEMCGHSGTIGQKCMGSKGDDVCREGDPLASDVDGSAVANDQSTSRARCIYKAMVMPDGVTVISAPWYEGAITQSGVDDQVFGPGRLLKTTPISILKRGCIHHKTIMSFAESVNVAFPVGNEIGDNESEDETDSVVDEHD